MTPRPPLSNEKRVSWLFRRFYTHDAPGDCENVGRFLFALLAGLVRHHDV